MYTQRFNKDRFKVWLHKTQDKVCTHTEESNIAGHVQSVAAQDTRQCMYTYRGEQHCRTGSKCGCTRHKTSMYTYRGEQHSRTGSKCGCTRHKTMYVHTQRRATFQDRFKVWLHKTQDKVCTHTEESNIPGQVQSVAAQDTRQGMYTYRGEQHSRTGSKCGCTRHGTHTEESNIAGQVQSVAAQDTRQGIYIYRGEQHSRTGSKCGCTRHKTQDNVCTHTEESTRTGSKCGCTRHKTRYVHIQRRATFQDRFKVWLHKTQDNVCTHTEESNIPGQVQSVAAQDKVCTHTEESNIPGQVQSVAAQDTRQCMYTYRGEQHCRTGSKCGCTRHKTRYVHKQRRATLQDRFKVWLHKTQDKVCTHTEESNIAGQVQSVAAQDTIQGMYTYRGEQHCRTGSKCGCTRHKTRYVHIQRRATFQDRFTVWLHKTQDKVCTHTEESNIPGQVQSVAAQDTRQGMYTYRGQHSTKCGCTRHGTHTEESNIAGQVQSVAAQDTRQGIYIYRGEQHSRTGSKCGCTRHKTQDNVCTHTEESNIPGQVQSVAARHKTRYVHIQRRATFQDRFKVWLHKTQDNVCTHTEESNIAGQVQSVAAQDTRQGMYTYRGEQHSRTGSRCGCTRHKTRYVHIQRRATFQDRFKVWLHKTQDKVCTHTEESNIPGQVQSVAAQGQCMYTYRGEQHCRTGSKCGCTRHKTRYRRATFQDRFTVWLHKTQDKVCTQTEESNIAGHSRTRQGMVHSRTGVAAQDTRQCMYTYRGEQHSMTGSKCGCTRHKTMYVHIQRRATLQDRFKVWLHKTQDKVCTHTEESTLSRTGSKYKVCTHTEESNIPGQVQSVAAQDKVCTHTEESNFPGQVQSVAAKDTRQGMHTYRGEDRFKVWLHKTRYVHIQRRATFQDRFKVWLHKTQDKVCTHTEESNIPGQVQSVAAQDTRQCMYTYRGEQHSRTGSKCGCTRHKTRYVHIQRRATFQDRFKVWLHKTQDKVCTHTEESNIPGQVQSVAAQDTRQCMYVHIDRGNIPGHVQSVAHRHKTGHSRTGSKCGCTRHKTRYVHIQRRATLQDRFKVWLHKTRYVHIQRRATLQDRFKVWLHKTRYVHIQRRATFQDRFKVWLHKTQDKVCTHTEESNIAGQVQSVATQDKVCTHTDESNIPGQVQSVAAQDTRQGMYTYRGEQHSRTGSKCGCTRHKTRYVHTQRRATLQDRFKVWLHKTRYVHIQRRATFQDRFKVWLHKTQDKVCTHTEESNIPGQVQSVAAQDTRQGMYTYRGEQHSRTGSKCGCTRHKTRYVHIQRRATFQDRFKVWLHKTQDKVCTYTEESNIPGQVQSVAAQDTRQGMYTYRGEQHSRTGSKCGCTRHKTSYVHKQRRATLQDRFKVWLHKTWYTYRLTTFRIVNIIKSVHKVILFVTPFLPTKIVHPMRDENM